MTADDTTGTCDDCGREPHRGLWRVVGGDVDGAYCLVCVDKLAAETPLARDVRAVPDDHDHDHESDHD